MKCTWQIEYGTGTGEDKLCGKPARLGFVWCEEHVETARNLYPRLYIPRVYECELCHEQFSTAQELSDHNYTGRHA